MFAKVLIANRGEIAVRVMRTCRELGIATVAVYSELDRDAMHVRYADEAYALGGQTAAESYLNTDAILDAIERSGAEAVHPGYGFFSENADFARAITERGVAWIGPPPEAIEIMGDKISSRKAAAAADVESVPGTLDPIQDAAEVVAFGNEFGWPVAIKAAYGGGGRGLKIAHSADEAAAAFESASREADRLLRARRVLHGALPHRARATSSCRCSPTPTATSCALGERDCSTQRRHQKLIEESPAPDLSDEIRAAMGEAAVKVARGCGYVNAGTVECLYQDGEFWFLEMNTRLQVEHCVTEEVTQLDLVAEQLRVAAGEPLSFTAGRHRAPRPLDRVPHQRRGPGQGLPPLARHHLAPAAPRRARRAVGRRLRARATPSRSTTTTCIGKLVVWGPDREAARHRMLRALGEFEISGLSTTIPAHVALLSHPDFAAVAHSTKWVEDEVDADRRSPTPRPRPTGAPADGADERRAAARAHGAGRGRRQALLGQALAARGRRRQRRGPEEALARVRARVPAGRAARPGSGTISAPMQGTIVKVLVAAGDTVEVGQSVLVLEAMKMENHINAEKSGTVAEVRVAEGDTVGTGDVLLVIE